MCRDKCANICHNAQAQSDAHHVCRRFRFFMCPSAFPFFPLFILFLLVCQVILIWTGVPTTFIVAIRKHFFSIE